MNIRDLKERDIQRNRKTDIEILRGWGSSTLDDKGQPEGATE